MTLRPGRRRARRRARRTRPRSSTRFAGDGDGTLACLRRRRRRGRAAQRRHRDRRVPRAHRRAAARADRPLRAVRDEHAATRSSRPSPTTSRAGSARSPAEPTPSTRRGARLRRVTERRRPTVLVEGLRFPEGPRWHDGRLVLLGPARPPGPCGRRPTGELETVVEVPEPAVRARLGPRRSHARRVDGRPSAAAVRRRPVSPRSPTSRRSRRGTATTWSWTRSGRAYVGNFGFDLDGGAAPDHREPRARRPRRLDLGRRRRAPLPERHGHHPRRRDADRRGELRRVRSPRSTSPPTARCRTGASGRSSHGAVPDGICLDAEGAIWSACPLTGRVLRVREGGEVTDVVTVDRHGAYACMLGGPDRTHAVRLHRGRERSRRETGDRCAARSRSCEVTVPGAGLPLTRDRRLRGVTSGRPGWVPSTISSSRRCVALACASSERMKKRSARTASTTRAARRPPAPGRRRPAGASSRRSGSRSAGSGSSPSALGPVAAATRRCRVRMNAGAEHATTFTGAGHRTLVRERLGDRRRPRASSRCTRP